MRKQLRHLQQQANTQHLLTARLTLGSLGFVPFNPGCFPSRLVSASSFVVLVCLLPYTQRAIDDTSAPDSTPSGQPWNHLCTPFIHHALGVYYWTPAQGPIPRTPSPGPADTRLYQVRSPLTYFNVLRIQIQALFPRLLSQSTET
jgi:hypothetical protein